MLNLAFCLPNFCFRFLCLMWIFFFSFCSPVKECYVCVHCGVHSRNIVSYVFLYKSFNEKLKINLCLKFGLILIAGIFFS